MNKHCPTCGEYFKVKPSHFARRKFCSVKCIRISEEAREKMRRAKDGYVFSDAHKAKLKESQIERYKSCAGYWLGKKRPSISGPNSHWWKGGKSAENNFLRHTLEYRLWRKSVFERDDYTCQDCQVRGGRLNADHVKPFALYPELRFAVDNGRTLCEICHRKTPTYGWNQYWVTLSGKNQ